MHPGYSVTRFEPKKNGYKIVNPRFFFNLKLLRLMILKLVSVFVLKYMSCPFYINEPLETECS